MSVDSGIARISDLDPYLSGNATLDSIEQNVGLLEKLVFGLILADVILFLLLVMAMFFACRSRRPYSRESVTYTTLGINAPHKSPIGDPVRSGLQT